MLLKKQETIDTLTVFEQNSGLKLNYDKSLIYRIGSLKDTDAMLYTTKTLAWTNEPFKVLGIEVSGSRNELIDLNYKDMYDKVETTLNAWQNRDLSLFGKTLIIKRIPVTGK